MPRPKPQFDKTPPWDGDASSVPSSSSTALAAAGDPPKGKEAMDVQAVDSISVMESLLPAPLKKAKLPASVQKQTESARGADEEDAARGERAHTTGGCYRLRHVCVKELLDDGTLGLLLHGTSVVGFCGHRAEEIGWLVGDQIVEVNGDRVTMFDEFLDRFMAAQQLGFPIYFSVLRREFTSEVAQPNNGAEGALERFFGATNLTDLAGQMQRKFGNAGTDAPARAEPASQKQAENKLGAELKRDHESITENPYIQALRRRRTEFLRSAEDWANDMCDSLASRLATQSDSLATLTRNGPSKELPTPRSETPVLLRTALPFEWFSCASTRCEPEVACSIDIQPSPRIDISTAEGVVGWESETWHSQHVHHELGTESERHSQSSWRDGNNSSRATPGRSLTSRSAPGSLYIPQADPAEAGPLQESKNFAQQLLSSR